jgi:hypothetical protein
MGIDMTERKEDWRGGKEEFYNTQVIQYEGRARVILVEGKSNGGMP